MASRSIVTFAVLLVLVFVIFFGVFYKSLPVFLLSFRVFYNLPALLPKTLDSREETDNRSEDRAVRAGVETAVAPHPNEQAYQENKDKLHPSCGVLQEVASAVRFRHGLPGSGKWLCKEKLKAGDNRCQRSPADQVRCLPAAVTSPKVSPLEQCEMISSTEKKWRLFRAWTSRNPLWCAWQVTYRCNFRCSFCGYWHDPMGLKAEPSVDDYADGARKLAGLGTLMVSLAGGEPFLRPDMPDIVRVIGKYHFPFVTTNGWFITPQVADDLMSAGLWGVSISIDYADAARHDARRGCEGAWAQAWRAVEMLSAARKHSFQRVNVIAVLMDDNIDQLEPLMELAAKHDAYFMVQPYGMLKTGSKVYEHNDGPVSPRLLELRRKWPNFLSNPYYLSRFDKFLHGGVPGCRAGRAFFNIDSTGDVAICVERRESAVANLYSDDVRTIRRRLRQASQANDCKSCWYNCRGEVECLYNPYGLARSLPTLLLDRGLAKAATPSNKSG